MVCNIGERIEPPAVPDDVIVAHFFRRTFTLIWEKGTFGLIGTKTVRRGRRPVTRRAAETAAPFAEIRS
ncbi:MAG: hypothetical protein U1E76_27980 [Planctomycetota bacterium]